MIVWIWVLGCESPFATRTPYEPDEPRPYQLLSRTSPGNILRNLKKVYDYAFSVDDYMDGLTEDFQFEPDPSDAFLYEDVFSVPWNRERERTFTTNLFDRIISDPSRVPRVLSRWDEITAEEEEENEAYFEYEYTLEFKDKQDAARKSAEGRAHLYLRRGEDENWGIYRWVDEKTNVEVSSWGALRARF